MQRPARMSGALQAAYASVTVGLAAAGPDQGEGLGAFVVEEVGLDRSVEARVVQLDGEIIAAIAGALRPGRPDLVVLRCTTYTQFGAAWKKTARESDREYLSVKLDDPSFPAPIYSSLVKVEGDEGFTLIWSRRNGE
jgi:uncharacterized protein (DUF736 family)